MFKKLSTIGLVLALVLSQVGAVQFSVAVRNARLDAIETAIGTAAVLIGTQTYKGAIKSFNVRANL